jgi:pimeloyl-ACP methyl ester carboxylesterase
MEPETRYATANEYHLAYQILGEGPPHLLMVPGLFSHLEMQWRLPAYRRFMRALAQKCRLVRYDKHGTGLSDPVAAVPGMDERIAEVAAVLDASQLGSTALFGFSEGGPIALHFAATHPHRVSALVLYGSYARKPPDAVLRQLSEIDQRWGTGETFELFAPGVRSPGDAPAAPERSGDDRARPSKPRVAKHIFAKLGVSTRAELAAAAARRS